MQYLFFPSLIEKPSKIRFSEQEPQETVELFLRQHPIVNVSWIIIAIIAAIIPPFLIQLDLLLNANILGPIPTQILIGSLSVYYLLIIGYIIENFLHWYFNVYIVTNIHVVDIDFESLLYRNITEIALSDVEAVSSTMTGIFGSVFNYGRVLVETAANIHAATFEKVPRPDFVADKIQDLRQLVQSTEE